MIIREYNNLFWKDRCCEDLLWKTFNCRLSKGYFHRNKNFKCFFCGKKFLIKKTILFFRYFKNISKSNQSKDQTLHTHHPLIVPQYYPRNYQHLRKTKEEKRKTTGHWKINIFSKWNEKRLFWMVGFMLSQAFFSYFISLKFCI